MNQTRLTVTVLSLLALLAIGVPAVSASGSSVSAPTLLDALGAAVTWVAVFLLVTLVLLMVVAGVLIWKAKQLVTNAVRPDPEALGRLVERLRCAHPDLDDDALCKKVIHRQANRAAAVGFVTGLGGLPFLPISLPIDIAATIRIQANMVHMIRLIRELSEDDVPEAGLWLATAGGVELATAGSTALKDLVIKAISKSLLKFLPLIGGVIGLLLNWGSTQTMGRLGLKWLNRTRVESQVSTPSLTA